MSRYWIPIISTLQEWEDFFQAWRRDYIQETEDGKVVSWHMCHRLGVGDVVVRNSVTNEKRMMSRQSDGTWQWRSH